MKPTTTTGQAQGHCLFDTAIGPCGLAWSERGLTRLQLPEATPEATERRLGSGPSDGAEQPSWVVQLILELQRYFAGSEVDFTRVPVDLGDCGELNRKVYDIARAIGWGQTRTYGDIAKQLGSLELSRAVGQALGQNPVPIVVPCHRVLASGNKIGGFSAPGGSRTKERLLTLEGVSLESDAPLLRWLADARR